MKSFLTISIILALSGSASAKETLNTVSYDGNAPISIDGNLADWDFLKLPATGITITNDWTMMPAPDSEADLSANFRCFIDNSFLYVGVEVTDDMLVFGQESFEYSWNDDAVDLKLDGDLQKIEKGYYDANDFQVRVSLDDTGETTLEGMVPFVEGLQIPTLWEKAGIQAVLLPANNAYTVEIAIPLYLLGYTSGAEVNAIGLNVQVYDDDNTGDFDHQLSWADDPDNTSWKSTETYNIVQYSQISPLSSTPIAQIENNDITIILNEPINSFSYGNIISALEKIKNGKYFDAEVFIDNIDVDYSILKGILYKNIENGDKAFTYLNRVSDERNTRIGRYVSTNKIGLADDKVALYQEYLESNQSLTNFEIFKIKDFLIKDYYAAGENEKAVILIMEILNDNVYDPITVDGFCKDLQLLDSYNEAIDYIIYYLYELNISNIISDDKHFNLAKRLSHLLTRKERYSEAINYLSKFANDGIYSDEANLLIAQNYFYMNEFAKATNVANLILKNSNNTRSKWNAQMIIKSIERAQ